VEKNNIMKRNDNIKQMKEVVKQLKNASKMHAQQAAKIEKLIKKSQIKKKK
tara:strand:- start:933 stop:1085 length:153 start_codon:yes stop_codon:yes gene_type:complete